MLDEVKKKSQSVMATSLYQVEYRPTATVHKEAWKIAIHRRAEHRLVQVCVASHINRDGDQRFILYSCSY